MKVIESLFETGVYDSKNILNKSDKVISQSVLENIESEGITSEILDTLGVPVFKYKTQITIHGLFPELMVNYLGGYKNLFQNKNLSIGCKWMAVDFAKKEYIYGLLRRSGWNVSKNSSEYFAYKTSETFSNRAEYVALLDKAKSEIEQIDSSLFVGNKGVYLSQTLWGAYYLVSYVDIKGVYQECLDKVVENILGKSIVEIKEAIRLKDEAREQEYKLDAELRNKQRSEREALEAPLVEAAKKELIELGYELVNKYPIRDGVEVVKLSLGDNEYKFDVRRYTKKAKERKWRYSIQYNVKDVSTVLWNDFDSRHEYGNDFVSGWIKVSDVVPAILENKTDNQSVTNEVVKIITVDYSDKAIAIFGDTKVIKDKLKQIGARFNPFLNYDGKKQAGWILPVTKRELLADCIR